MEEAETAVQCLDKCIVSQGTELPSSPSAKSSHITSLNYNSGNVQAVAQKEKSDMIPKIKWGNLEDDALVLCRETLDMTEIKFGNLGEDKSLMCRKLGNTDDSVSSGSCTDPREDKSVVTTEDADDLPAETVLLSPSNKSFKPNQGDFNEKGPEGTDLLGEHRKMPNLENSNPCKIEHEHGRPIEINLNDGLNFNVPGSEHSFSLLVDSVRTPMSPQGQEDNPEEAAVDISEVPDEGSSSIVVSEKDSVLPEVPKSVSESSGDVLVSDTDKHRNQSEDGIISEDCPGTQLMNDPTEGESGESKERFRQRLWCFLFENLNRAVDELYLLCELECDSEQIKESIIVLEEARSDFKELKSRVEGFEIMRKSSSQPPVDGLLLNEKTDHRRPHALSWEVRRMTASPHRAEILSSSLEAFKKIQNERTSTRKVHDTKFMDSSVNNHFSSDLLGKLAGRNDRKTNAGESIAKSRKQSGAPEPAQRQGARASKVYRIHDSQLPPQNLSTLDSNASQISLKNIRPTSVSGKSKKESHTSASDSEKQVQKKDKMLTEGKSEKNPKYMEPLKRQITPLDREKEKEKKNSALWKSMNAWKEKRNWEDILTSPIRISSRVSHSPGMSRKSVERARVLHDKLMSPEKKKKTALDLRKEAEEKHARAMKIRSELENERVQRLQRTSEKLNRVNEWQAVRTMKLREGMHARHQRSESRYEAHLAQVVRRAGDESSKVNEVRFITSLNEENKKLILRQKLHDSQLRRDEKLQIIKSKQKEDMAREEAVVERRKILQAEKLQRLAETQRKKEEALVRREEERKASSAAREARAIEQLRRKEIRAKAQQEEAELLAQKLAERLNESEQRRKFYLEQIREKASMDFRDQLSPLLRRSSNKDSLGRSTSTSNGEDYQATNISSIGNSSLRIGDSAQQHSLKRRIKKIRQRLMALKYEFSEPPVSAESVGIGYRSLVGTARAKIGRWLQDLQRLRQARKEGAGSIGLIVADMIKFLEGKEPELHASRQAGLLDFIASALPASHTPRPEACQVTIYLLRLVRVVLSLPANRSYFLAQNLLPPIIPMLSAAIENYIKIAASLNISGSNSSSSKTSVENFESVSEVLEGYLWTVTSIIGHVCSDEKQLQMKDGLLELVISCQVIHRLRDLFALHDRPQVEGSPFPSSIVLSLNLLAVVTSRSGTGSTIDWGSFPSKTFLAGETKEVKPEEFLDLTDPSSNVTDGGYRSPLSAGSVTADRPLSNVPEDRPLDESTMRKHENSPLSARNPDKGLTDDRSIDFNRVSSDLQMHVTDATGQKNDNIQDLKQPVIYLLSVIADTGLVSLPSLLTAVLLQANNRLSTEQASYVLPSNFEEVATGVLKVLNNLAHLDLTLMQRMLARPDLKMEFFHFMSFLLSHCTSKWKMAGDQVGLLLLESLLLLGYFALFHPGNQAVLRWGKSPTILHKVCDLPFVFFSDPELMPILAGTLVGACYGCEQNRCVVQQELSTEMLLSLLGSCRNGLPTVQASPSLLDTTGDRDEANQLVPEAKKAPVDTPVKSGRHISRNSKVSSGKGVSLGSSTRVSKVRNHSKMMKTCEEWAIKHNHPASEASSSFMLHCRFPSSFIDRAEEFFSSGIPNVA